MDVILEPQNFIINDICDDQSLLFWQQETEVIWKFRFFLVNLPIFLIFLLSRPKLEIFRGETNQGGNLRHVDKPLLPSFVPGRETNIFI